LGAYTPPLIEPDRPTLGSFLRQNGYTTACIGKWYLGLGWTRMSGFTPSWEDGERYWLEHWFGSWQDGDPERGFNVDFTKTVQHGPADLGFDYAYFTAACSTIDGPFVYIENRELTAFPDEFVEKDTTNTLISDPVLDG